MKQNKKNILVLLLLTLLLGAFPASAQWSTSGYSGLGLPGGTIYNIIQTLMKWLLAIFSLVAIIGFTISGIMYLTAAGDEDQQQRAKKAMYYSIIGVVVGLSGLVIFVAVDTMLKGSSTTF
jgi:hypothetical protein